MSQSTLKISSGWPAPAKLNLMLRIVGQRDDGYHLLQTVFQFIDFQDQLAFSIRHDSTIRRITDLPDIPQSEDLVVRAAKLLQNRCKITLGVDISLSKQIPMGGGLGGGSSDAATTLTALNQLWGCHLADDELAQLGLQLGADVPVFIHGFSAWGEGVGDSLSRIELIECWYLLLFPDCHVPTAKIFHHPELTRNSVQVTIADFISGTTTNDCLQLVRKLYPAVDQALKRLSEFAEARMTGTGATVFAEFDSRISAQKVLNRLSDEFDGLVVRGVNRSPLLDRKSQ